MHSIQDKAIKKPTPKVAQKNLCEHCLSKIGKGESHVCNLETLSTNMQAIALKNPTVGQKVAAKVLRSKKPSPGGRVHLDLRAGRSKLKVVVDAPKGLFEKKQVSATELHEFCLDCSCLSDLNTKWELK